MRVKMDCFDSIVLSFFNGFSQRSWTFDNLMVSLSGNNLLKGGLAVAVLWWIWFASYEKVIGRKNRETVLASLVGAFGAVFLARMLALTLPFRLRPLYDPGIAFRVPYGSDLTVLDGWSSFPSDHAALFFGLATGLLFISRRLGLLGFFYVLTMIAIPRIYTGYHYPTDIVAGAILGMVTTALVNMSIVKYLMMKRILYWSESYPPSFYALFFLLTYQVATLFDGVRGIAGVVFKVLARLVFQSDV